MSNIDEIRQKTDIVDVISESVQLKKAGRNFQALCPFHPEKTPSFIVFPERQTWHCFGACGTGGDVFAFLMKKENLEFSEALRLLARRAGVTLAPPSPETKAKEERQEKLYQATEAAAQFYQNQLLHSAAGGGARRYLEERGLNPQTIQDFQLGFNPTTSSGLCTHLLGKGYSKSDLAAAGLVIETETKETHDRFPGRLIFPIRNVQGRVAGFGARALDKSLPKYINTPQSEIFDKGGLLYGLERAKVSLQRLNQVILVEGYMDALMAHQHGFAQVVASMGTSLTEKQVGLIKRYTKNIILALDADAAGAEATLRAHESVIRAQEATEKITPLVTPQGIKYENILDTEIRVLVPPQGKDPDEVIRESTVEWQRLIDKARPLTDFVLDKVASQHDLSQASGKAHAAQECLPFIAEIKDPIRQAFYLQKLARILAVDEADLKTGLQKIGRGLAHPASSFKKPNAGREEGPSLVSHGERSELYCLAMLIRHPGLRSLGEKIYPDYFESSQNREIFRSWQKAADNTDLAENLDPALLPLLNSLQNWPLPPATEGEQERFLVDALRRLKKETLSRLWKSQEAALLGEVGLEKFVQQGMDTTREMQQIFEQRQRRAKLGE